MKDGTGGVLTLVPPKTLLIHVISCYVALLLRFF
eukprot:SAG11_NODE_10789_length_805_cov_1.381020_1_plen_33_part_10